VNRGGGHDTHYPFQITYRGVTIGLGDWNAGERKADNLFVRLTGKPCLLIGGWNGYHIVRELIDKLGGEVVAEHLTRVDLCLDISNVSAEELQRLVENQQFITRFKKVRPENELVQSKKAGFAAGKNPQRLICYDKLWEQHDSYDELYRQALITRRYGGVTPQCAVRLEAQCHRPFLLEKGIDTPADVALKASHLLHDICTTKFRIVDRPVDRKAKNHQRAEMHDLWCSIVSVIPEVLGKLDGELAPIDRSGITPLKLYKQGLGCFVSAALQMGIPIRRMRDFHKLLKQIVQDVLDTFEKREKFIADYLRRLEEFGT
jgi:hypothetical protein